MRRALLAAALLACLAAAVAASPASAATWCGTDASAPDRLPEAVAGRQVHVVYAFPSDGVDRFATDAGAIVGDLTAIDAWWRSQDPTRAPRFDLFAFPGCAPGLGGLDISRVQLPNTGAWYQPLGERFSRLANDLAAPPTALDNPGKKYLVYYDGPVDESRVCGFSPVLPFNGGAGADSFIFLGSTCPQDLGSAGFLATAAAHELTHNLGALVFNGPLHACPGDPGHPCDSDHDLMFPFLRFPLSQLLLDSGHDDYYAHSGTWFDVQDSGWLAHVADPQIPLAVTVAGSGTGSVASGEPGIACPPACTIAWDSASQVALEATAGPRTRFAGWSGACTGLGVCALTMDAAKTVTARFAAQVALSVQVRGAGTVTSRPAGVACPSTCREEVDQGAVVKLTAKPKRGSRFAAWTGGCRGAGSCTLRLDTAQTVRATFRRAK